MMFTLIIVRFFFPSGVVLLNHSDEGLYYVFGTFVMSECSSDLIRVDCYHMHRVFYYAVTWHSHVISYSVSAKLASIYDI